MVVYDTMPTPIGVLLLTAEDGSLTGIHFEPSSGSHRLWPEWHHTADVDDQSSTVIAEARAQLDAYFAGERNSFTLPLAPRGTPFQQRVWTALREIGFGHSISYLELARLVGDEKAVRAVGGANARNPLPVVVPCHRVIGSDGSLTGFGGGIERKRWLLRHEGVLPADPELSLGI
jgi:methylated-DNA-[protein]-cysteine S-methyltransferase